MKDRYTCAAERKMFKRNLDRRGQTLIYKALLTSLLIAPVTYHIDFSRRKTTKLDIFLSFARSFLLLTIILMGQLISKPAFSDSGAYEPTSHLLCYNDRLNLDPQFHWRSFEFISELSLHLSLCLDIYARLG